MAGAQDAVAGAFSALVHRLNHHVHPASLARTLLNRRAQIMTTSTCTSRTQHSKRTTIAMTQIVGRLGVLMPKPALNVMW